MLESVPQASPQVWVEPFPYARSLSYLRSGPDPSLVIVPFTSGIWEARETVLRGEGDENELVRIAI